MTQGTDLDLTAIEERVGGDLPVTSWIWREDVPALIAEVRRLRVLLDVAGVSR